MEGYLTELVLRQRSTKKIYYFIIALSPSNNNEVQLAGNCQKLVRICWFNKFYSVKPSFIWTSLKIVTVVGTSFVPYLDTGTYDDGKFDKADFKIHFQGLPKDFCIKLASKWWDLSSTQDFMICSTKPWILGKLEHHTEVKTSFLFDFVPLNL